MVKGPQALPLLTVEQIKAADDIQYEYVDVPEWGGRVKVRGLDGLGRDRLDGQMLTIRGNKRELNLANARARLITMTVVNEEGQLMLSLSDLEWLGRKSGLALDRVFTVAQRLSGLSENDLNILTAELGNDLSAGSGSG